MPSPLQRFLSFISEPPPSGCLRTTAIFRDGAFRRFHQAARAIISCRKPGNGEAEYFARS